MEHCGQSTCVGWSGVGNEAVISTTTIKWRMLVGQVCAMEEWVGVRLGLADVAEIGNSA